MAAGGDGDVADFRKLRDLFGHARNTVRLHLQHDVRRGGVARLFAIDADREADHAGLPQPLHARAPRPSRDLPPRTKAGFTPTTGWMSREKAGYAATADIMLQVEANRV